MWVTILFVQGRIGQTSRWDDLADALDYAERVESNGLYTVRVVNRESGLVVKREGIR